MLGRYEEADAAIEQAIIQAPDEVGGHIVRYYVNLAWHGSGSRAHSFLEEIPESRRDNPLSGATWSAVEFRKGNYEAALAHIAPLSDEFPYFGGIIGLQRAYIYDASGDEEKARASYESARRYYDKKIQDNPEDYDSHVGLGKTLAGLGRKDEAIRSGKRGVELCPVSRDALDGPGILVELTRIYTMTGDREAALDTLEEVLALPTGTWNLNLLRADPGFDPLRDHPRFKELEKRFG
jgi:tetratricopeptide (TPR) repeat protein